MKILISSDFQFTRNGMEKQSLYVQTALEDNDLSGKTDDEIKELIKHYKKLATEFGKAQYTIICKELYKRALIDEEDFKIKLGNYIETNKKLEVK